MQWLNSRIENLGHTKGRKIEDHSDEKQEDQETKCCLRSVLHHIAGCFLYSHTKLSSPLFFS